MLQIKPAEPQNTIDILLELCNNFNLFYGDDLYLRNLKEGKLQIKKWRNYIIPFSYKNIIITIK